MVSDISSDTIAPGLQAFVLDYNSLISYKHGVTGHFLLFVICWLCNNINGKMNWFPIAVVILSLGSRSLGQIIAIGQCPEHPVVQNFDLQAYVGYWYEISRYERDTQRGAECVQVNYTLNADNSVRVENRQLIPPSGEFDVIVGRSVLSFPDENPLQGKFNLTFGAMPPILSNYWVLDTDYTSFSFVWGCFPVSDTIRGENFWLLSRTVEVPQAVQARIDALIDLYLVREHIRTTSHDLHYCVNQDNLGTKLKKRNINSL
ncbi:apolipoprotein D-like [Sabethes cyaneus]|uniref:apolipoprotein D-like n=1 Tax=Sabethes cyaneus TaxID=53552 RepID=UPI00237D8241|nr:apolipoprotein D-like [Sabethes cyaneus]